MANPRKAQLTPGQGAAAVIAGVIGHILFSISWTSLVLSVIGLVAKNLLMGLVRGWLGGLTLEGELGAQLRGAVAAIESAIGVISVVLVVVSVLGVLFAFFISWLILKLGRVRKPGGVTITSFVIVAILDAGLFWVYVVLGNTLARNVDSASAYVIVWLVGTAVVGALIWLWMVWARRGPAPDVAPAVVAADRGAVDGTSRPAVSPAAQTAPAGPVAEPVADPVQQTAEDAAVEPPKPERAP